MEIDPNIWRGIGIALAIQLALVLGWWLARERGSQRRAGRLWGAPALATWCLVLLGLVLAAVTGLLIAIGTRWEFPLALFALGAAALAALGFASRNGREEARRSLDVIEAAPLGIVACDRSGRLTVVNPQMWKMLGAPAGIPVEQLGNLLDHPRVAETDALELVRRVLEAGETFATEASYESVWRGLRKFRVVGGPLRGAGGEIEGALFLLEDVTERTVVLSHLRDTDHLDAMGRLASLIASELNDPLAYVRTNLAAMREELLRLGGALEGRSAPLIEFARILDESADGVERAIGLVRDLRGRALDTEFDAPVERTPLTPLLRGCVRVAAARPKSCAMIDEKYAEQLAVLGAPSQLRQVFLPLLVNAVEAAGERGHVRVRTLPEDGFAVVRVSDDGPGFPPELSDRIFEPSLMGTNGEARGLELFIAREIALAHRGEIRLYSRPGEGATFEVRLPLDAAAHGSA